MIRERHHVLHRTAKLFHACTAAQSLAPRETALLQRPALTDSALGADTHEISIAQKKSTWFARLIRVQTPVLMCITYVF